MGAFLRRFWVAAGSLAALAGGYLAAVPLHLVILFWVVVAGGAVVAAVSVFIPRSIEYATRIRNYDLLLKRVATLEHEKSQLDTQLNQLQAALNEQHENGIREGRSQFLGSLLASASPILSVVGLAVRDGVLLMVAKADGSKPENGARYYVESGLLGDIMGVVEVRAYDGERDILILECVEPRRPGFWARLEDAATIDPSPPPGVTLAPYRVDVQSIRAPSAVSDVPEKADG